MATSPALRVFLDTNVLFSALQSPKGLPARILRLHADRRIQVVVSAQVLRELVRNVSVKSPENLALLRELIFAGNLEIAVNPSKSATAAVFPRVNWDDAPIVAAAIAADVDYFVTGDKRLVTEIITLNPPFRTASPRELVEAISQ
jgi:putative PIN family toxin of toxin-antitoxin system